MPPFEIQVFSPVSRTVPSGIGVAASAIWATSEPASGSVSAKAAMRRPARTPGSTASRCAGEPASVSAPVPSPCMAKAKSASPSWRAKVSRRRQSARTSNRPSSGAA